MRPVSAGTRGKSRAPLPSEDTNGSLEEFSDAERAASLLPREPDGPEGAGRAQDDPVRVQRAYFLASRFRLT